MLLLIFLSVIASSSTEDPLAGHRCTFISRDDGFKCLNGGGCIPLKWVCDDEEQVRGENATDQDVLIQSASIAQSQGLLESFVEVLQAGGPYYNCGAVRQEENCQRNLHKNLLANLATELLTHSVVLFVKYVVYKK